MVGSLSSLSETIQNTTGMCPQTCLITVLFVCAVPEKIHTHPEEGHYLEIPRGRGVLEAKILEAKYQAKLEFPGERGVQNKSPL